MIDTTSSITPEEWQYIATNYGTLNPDAWRTTDGD